MPFEEYDSHCQHDGRYCRARFVRIVNAARAYAEENAGVFPEDLDILLDSGYLKLENEEDSERYSVCHCPAVSKQLKYRKVPYEEIVNRGSDYTYLGAGLTLDADNQPIFLEKAGNHVAHYFNWHYHSAGVFVGYLNGDVEWLCLKDGEQPFKGKFEHYNRLIVNKETGTR